MSYWDTNYPTHIEVPEGYWTITTTINTDFEEGRHQRRIDKLDNY